MMLIERLSSKRLISTGRRVVSDYIGHALLDTAGRKSRVIVLETLTPDVFLVLDGGIKRTASRGRLTFVKSKKKETK
jgi:hypothetical protein